MGYNIGKLHYLNHYTYAYKSSQEVFDWLQYNYASKHRVLPPNIVIKLNAPLLLLDVKVSNEHFLAVNVLYGEKVLWFPVRAAIFNRRVILISSAQSFNELSNLG